MSKNVQLVKYTLFKLLLSKVIPVENDVGKTQWYFLIFFSFLKFMGYVEYMHQDLCMNAEEDLCKSSR